MQIYQLFTTKNFSHKMFVNKVGLPIHGVDGNANLVQCVIEQHELAIAVQLNCVNFLEAVKMVFATFKILKT